MKDRLEGIRRVGARIRGLSREAVQSLARSGRLGRPAGAPPSAPTRSRTELRLDARCRTRLRSAKVLDAANGFLCEAIVHDRSAGGLRLSLIRNVGLPGRFGVHDDETGEVFTVTAAWRRGQTLGVRFLHKGTTIPVKPSDQLATGGRYYAVRD